MPEQDIVKKLLEYGKTLVDSGQEAGPTSNKDVNDLILSDSNAFLFAVILDEKIDAERAWTGSYLLKERLGHLDPREIASMSREELARIGALKPEIHYYYNKAAARIQKACELLLKKYQGRADNIWNDSPRTDDLQRRFEEFNGIGQKKSSMAVNMLVRDSVISGDKRWIDVSNDSRVRRVFQRTGLVKTDTQKALIEAARRLNPDYPGALDLPSWSIGGDYCHPSKPDCSSCPLETDCPKII
jgi:uncharacterized HhH-GPD family protein